MSENTTNKSRYSDAELAEFRAVIEQKIEKTEKQLDTLKENIAESRENAQDDHADYGDEGSQLANIEYLDNMVVRQEKYLAELNQALARVINKNYGICEVTGELIDKRRLMAVPITTKCLAAKIEREKTKASAPTRLVMDEEKEEGRKQKKKNHPVKNKVFSRIIKKPNAVPPSANINDDDDDLDDIDDTLEFEIDDSIDIGLEEE